MKRIFSEDATYSKLSAKKAIERFCKKYGKEEWLETFEWMLETNTEFFCDNVFADGQRNNSWRYALHLEVIENYTYIALIERA